MVETAPAERVCEGAVVGGTIEMIGSGSEPAPNSIRRHDNDASGASPARQANTAATITNDGIIAVVHNFPREQRNQPGSSSTQKERDFLSEANERALPGGKPDRLVARQRRERTVRRRYQPGRRIRRDGLEVQAGGSFQAQINQHDECLVAGAF